MSALKVFDTFCRWILSEIREWFRCLGVVWKRFEFYWWWVEKVRRGRGGENIRHMGLAVLRRGISMAIHNLRTLSRTRITRLSINMRHRPLLLSITGRNHLLITGRRHPGRRKNWIGDTRGLLITIDPWTRLDNMQRVISYFLRLVHLSSLVFLG